jgi:hypothetical protein
VNGVDDVYEWTAEKTTLISTGKSRDASRFGGASPDGRDVFFLTSERLVAQDVDDDTDLYDARVGGGIPAQNVRLPAPAGACKEDACQKPGARPAPATDPSTETMGAGNPAPGKRAALSGGRLDKQQLTALGKGRRVTLRVTVNRAGWVRIAAQAVVGRGLRTVASGSRRARGAATVSVPLRLSPVAQRELRKRRTLTLNLRVRFDGAPARTQTAVLRSSTTTDATRRSAAVPSSRKAR